MDDDDALDTLLSAATEELPCTSRRSNDEKFLENISNFVPHPSTKKLKSKVTELVVSEGTSVRESNVHTGETDSSDDEENRYFESCKYDSFGSAIKQMLAASSSTPSGSKVKDEATWQTKAKQLSVAPPKAQPKTDVYTDPVFGIRIVNPLVSGSLLQERMSGRVAVSMAKLKTHIKDLKNEIDWVIAGAIVHKSAARTSQKGSSYTIWTLSDLHHDLKTVTLFLFGNAFKELWKTGTGTVVGILNPSVFDKNSNTRDEAALSVDNAQKVMILGQSKDLGTCKSTKKNGDHCTAFVNTNQCEFCLYHIKQEYQKCTKRSELQSNFSGRGLTALRNKVLGKNEVFYAGKSYTAIRAGKNKKLAAKDDRRLQALSNNVTVNAGGATKINNLSKRKAAAHLELSANQRAKDLEMLKKLAGNSNQGGGNNKPAPFNMGVSSDVTLEESKRAAVSVISKLKAAAETSSSNVGNHDNVISNTPPKVTTSNITPTVKDEAKTNPVLNVPLLSKSDTNKVDLNAPISRRLVNRAKRNALSWVKQNGPIKKSDPMNTRGTQGKKRPLDTGVDDNTVPTSAKQQRIEQNGFFSERFKKIMAISSRHSDLLRQHDNEEEEKYFNKLEKKEQMEEKMLSTYKLQCKAVRCLRCKYTSFSAADSCKVEKHPLKVFDAVKRFFKCGDCKNRTVTLSVVPTVPCAKCGGGKWERAPMLREKEIGTAHCLSIRGGEQTFLNSGLNNANLDLLVPDDK